MGSLRSDVIRGVVAKQRSWLAMNFLAPLQGPTRGPERISQHSGECRSYRSAFFGICLAATVNGDSFLFPSRPHVIQVNKSPAPGRREQCTVRRESQLHNDRRGRHEIRFLLPLHDIPEDDSAAKTCPGGGRAIG